MRRFREVLRGGVPAAALLFVGCSQRVRCANADAGRDGCGSGGRSSAGGSGGEIGGVTQTAAGGQTDAGDSVGTAGNSSGGNATGTAGNSSGGNATGAAGNSSGGNTGAGGNSGTGGHPAGGGASGTGGYSATGGSSGTGSSGTSGQTGTGGGGIPPVTCAPPGAPNTCGNGVVDPGEQCDGAALRGLSCATVDPFFTGGTLLCSDSCTLDTTKCMHGTCGNGVIDPGEDCEYDNFTRVSCSAALPAESDYALVGCSISTCRYTLSTCALAPAPVCGNGKLESGEQCDGEDWLWRACVEHSPENTGGQLRCNQATCMLDFTQCTRCDGARCGDGIIDPTHEQCDGTNLGSHSCADVNRVAGTVSCLDNCNLDYSKCHGGCTVFQNVIHCD